MSVWTCLALIATAGAFGGVINALQSDNGFVFPYKTHSIWCPGFISNVLIGAVASSLSWALYGAGESVNLASATDRTIVSFRLSAVAGAFLVGVAGARWITSQADKQLLKESVRVAGEKKLPPDLCQQILQGSPREILKNVDLAPANVEPQMTAWPSATPSEQVAG